ncbi:MAG: hypothetical protein PHO08_20540 [Methylococcales bacterium]|nr:hypothetical protein [Methylococcales bacterium]
MKKHTYRAQKVNSMNWQQEFRIFENPTMKELYLFMTGTLHLSFPARVGDVSLSR